MIVAVARFTPTDVYPPHGDEWEAFGFDDAAQVDAWLNGAGLWYPDAMILEVRRPAERRSA